MYISNEGILVVLFVGLVAGWLAGKIVRGTGFGIIGDILVGIAGALLGKPAVSQARHSDRHRTDLRDRYSTIGAIILLLIVRLGADWRTAVARYFARPTASTIQRRTAAIRRSRACSVRETR
jgi:uncharacterized membrane protein YeaQ/YmgE (transglycosylase-associated protein family)